MQFIDAAPIAGTRRTEDGYLVTQAKAVRTGIQLYLGDELGKPDMPIVRVYRPPEEVFSDASLQSFTHAPVTINHPADHVTAQNWKDLAVGEVSTMAKKDGDWVMLPLILKDAEGIAAVESGKRELSAGYSCTLDWTAGTAPDGQQFDAVQRNIKINHLAIVDAARAGSEARIGDGAKSWGASPVNHQTADERTSPMADNLRKVLVDGLQVETTDAGATAIEKLTKDKAAVEQKLVDAESEHAKAIAAKDAEIAKKDAEIDTLKKAAVTDAELDKRAAARADLIGTAKAIVADVKTEGLSDADIRKAVVAAKLGDAAIKDKSEAYIDVRFDILAEDAKKVVDPFKATVAGGIKTPVSDNDAAAAAYTKMVQDMQSAHLPAKAN